MIAVYFPVMTNDYSTTKSLEIRMAFGWQGYGIYLAILQKLASTEARAYNLNEIPALAFDLHLTLNEVQPIIEKYFESDEQTFFSKELNESLSYYDLKYQKHSEGGKKTQAKLTPEERTAKARLAGIESGKVRTKSKDELSIELSSELIQPSNLVNRTNNRIEYNRIEKNRTKEKEQPSALVLEGSSLSSLASPSVLAQTLNNPKVFESSDNTQSKDDFGNTPKVEFKSLFFSGSTTTMVEKWYNDFLVYDDGVQRQGITPTQFEKLLVYDNYQYFEKSNKVMTKEQLIGIVEYLYKEGKTILPKTYVKEFDELIFKFKTTPIFIEDFNNTIMNYVL